MRLTLERILLLASIIDKSIICCGRLPRMTRCLETADHLWTDRRRYLALLAQSRIWSKKPSPKAAAVGQGPGSTLVTLARQEGLEPPSICYENRENCCRASSIHRRFPGPVVALRAMENCLEGGCSKPRSAPRHPSYGGRRRTASTGVLVQGCWATTATRPYHQAATSRTRPTGPLRLYSAHESETQRRARGIVAPNERLPATRSGSSWNRMRQNRPRGCFCATPLRSHPLRRHNRQKLAWTNRRPIAYRVVRRMPRNRGKPR